MIAVPLFCDGKVVVEVLGSKIHSAVQINAGIVIVVLLAAGYVVSVLIMGDTCVIIKLSLAKSLFKGAAVGGLVAHGPAEDTRAVLVPHDASHGSVHRGRGI